jgi:cis-3-alkyl-4-acyloxetan-2-one decarboxylase
MLNMDRLKFTFDTLWHSWLKRPYRLKRTLDRGDGQQLVVLIHGLAATSQSWLGAAKQLESNKYRLVGYDLLGFGASPKPTRSFYSADEHAKALAHSIKKDFPNRPLIIVGHSMGCIVASRLSTTSKLKIRQCILYQPPLLNVSAREKRSLHASIYRFIANKPSLILTYSKLAGRMAGRLSLFTVNPQTWLAFERSLKNTILGQQTLEELKKIPFRTDIIYGRFDFVVSRRQAKNLIDTNPNIVLHKVAEIHDISPRAGRYIKKILQ